MAKSADFYLTLTVVNECYSTTTLIINVLSLNILFFPNLYSSFFIKDNTMRISLLYTKKTKQHFVAQPFKNIIQLIKKSCLNVKILSYKLNRYSTTVRSSCRYILIPYWLPQRILILCSTFFIPMPPSFVLIRF